MAQLSPEILYWRSIRRAQRAIARAEREGFGHDVDSSVATIRTHLRTALRAACQMPADPARAREFHALLFRADQLGAGL